MDRLVVVVAMTGWPGATVKAETVPLSKAMEERRIDAIVIFMMSVGCCLVVWLVGCFVMVVAANNFYAVVVSRAGALWRMCVGGAMMMMMVADDGC